MSSENVETHCAAHESWNRRDFQSLVRNVAEGLVYNGSGGVHMWTVVTRG